MADNNVLGVLFQDIADAIRGKTGGTETMKPADFPANITAIEAGGGGGGTIIGKTFTFTGSTTYPVTVTHDLGVTPFLIAVCPTEGMGSSKAERELYMCICFNTEMRNKIGLSDYGYAIVQHPSAGPIFSHPRRPIEEAYAYGFIGYANETTFKIGSSSSCALRAVSYTCTVIGIQE